ncbi:MAG: GNAT family N-acetyltransferase [Saprospiraceae bacterium]
MIYKASKGDYSISTDKRKLSIPTIHNYLKKAYWSKNKPIYLVQKSIKGSICFGVYHKKRQVGFARVITDLTTFGYLADVFILPKYQGQGLGKFLIKTIMECPDFQGFRSWSLATKDAHGLYAKFGFKEMEDPKIWMRKVNFSAY